MNVNQSQSLAEQSMLLDKKQNLII